MKYFVIAGERSGDQHGAELMKAIIKADPSAIFKYVGGEAMSAINPNRIMDINDLSVMGVKEVILKLPILIERFNIIKKAILNYSPHVVIFIDYAGMNLRLAKWAKMQGFRTCYFILPKAWAWKANRAEKLKRYIDLNLAIFPFEVSFFLMKGVTVSYIGNPSYQKYIPFRKEKIVTDSTPVLAFMLGSRKQEIKALLPTYIKAAQALRNDFKIIFSKSTNIDISHYKDVKLHNFGLSENYDHILKTAHIAVVTSGTATLEVAAAGIPQLVAYKTSPLTFLIAKLFINLPYISLVNIISGERLVQELIQDECNSDNIIDSIRAIADIKEKSEYYKLLDEKLKANEQSSYGKAANLILTQFSSKLH